MDDLVAASGTTPYCSFCTAATDQQHIPPTPTLLAPSMPPPSSAGPGPSSQVTADVVKFRCLFTHDLRRKSKRWQDGYLRFHTFNRRIMVFDEQGNFIGDHHWRSGDPVQDGDEMELDQGALIQVGECMGTAQTDLSSLLEKRKPSQGSPQSETQPRPSSLSVRSQTTQSRSLNDMLGIKRTPIAHLVSPYEERHPPTPVENVRPSQPPPKRQKTSAVDSSTQRAVVDLTQPKKGPKSMRSAPSGTSTREKPKPAAESQSARSSLSKDTSKIAPPTKPSSNVGNTCPPALTPDASRPAPTFSSGDSTRDAPPSSAQLPERPQLSRNGLLVKSRSFAGTSASDTPMNTLRMAVEKPRKKLMYQALLPSEKSQKSSSELSMPPPKKPSSRPTSTSVETQTAVSLDVDSNEFAPSESTQFILEEMISGPRPEQPVQPPHIKATSSPVPQRLPSAAGRAAGRSPNATEASSLSGIPQLPINPPTTSTPPVPRQTRSPNNGPPSTTHPSENPQNAAPTLPAQRRLKAPLRKSLSDPIALIGQTSLQPKPALTKSSLSTMAEQDESQDQGPWSAEALDLFDFWPPGRPKPVESRL